MLQWSIRYPSAVGSGAVHDSEVVAVTHVLRTPDRVERDQTLVISMCTVCVVRCKPVVYTAAGCAVD